MNNTAPRWIYLITALVLAFQHAPLLVLVLFSFNESKISATWDGFTLHWYARLLEREDLWDALFNSLLVGGIATAVSTVLGTLMALALARRQLPGRAVLDSLVYVPVVTPEIVAGVSLLLLFASMGMELGLLTITLAHIAFCISFVVIVVRARLEGMDRSLEEAALVLGADEWTTFWRVTVPQLWPGILSGALLAFIMSFDDYVITALVSGPGSSTLPLVVYSMVRKNVEPSVNAISALVLVLTTVLIVWSDRLARRETRLDP